MATRPQKRELWGVGRIAAERHRQLTETGYDATHDDEHEDGELALAAIAYAAPERVYLHEQCDSYVRFADPFPWDMDEDERPRTRDHELKHPTLKQRIRLLEKAGALIAAEIDRLLRVKT